MSWIVMSMLFASAHHLAAQCIPPAAIWLHTQQSSTALTFNWVPVAAATQYQLRYWETAAPEDKTIVDNFAPAPSILNGLKKSSHYTLDIRSKCGGSFSAWGTSVTYFTNYDTSSCSTPTGVLVSAGASGMDISWTSSGSHTVRYRLGNTGDWLIPTGALSVSASPFSITGLSSGDYQVEVKRNCSATASDFISAEFVAGATCAPPLAPGITPGVTSASVNLPVASGVTGYNVAYRPGATGNWITVGSNILLPLFHLNPPLTSSTTYQVQIQAICGAGSSGFSIPATFTTQATGLCLADKNFGKNLSGEAMVLIDQNFNTPSPYALFSMIGVNDGGLLFRAFQNANSNQITRLTTQYRNFHTIDDDFDNTLVNYTQNTKPKNTSPEGTPAFTGLNKGFYSIYRKKHGFTNITAAIELLQYSPQSWKEKIYKESDWSAAGPAGIKKSFETYTKKFIDVFAPANGVDSQILVMNFQVGNELWDYPVKSDYHSMLTGARSAFINKYGEKSAGGWKMQLVVGAFQAFQDNNCTGVLRDFSNCDGSLDRHDFIGDYLAIEDCDILKDIDAIDCHSYSFLPRSTTWTYPENPESETGQIRNLGGWLDVNRNSATGVLSNTRLWATEFGFDSNLTTGVGEKTQSAYLLRGLLLHSRYHYEKVFFYNAFDHTRSNDVNYTGLYNSSGLWTLGTHPANSAWSSPLAEHGAKAKPAWFGLMDLKFRFGGHVFYKALVEDTDAYVFLLATADGTDPFLVFWSPQQTTDANLNVDIPISKVVNWSDAIGNNFKVETPMAQAFALDAAPGPTFMAATNVDCGTATLKTIRRNPSFLHLVPCINCPNITDPGSNTAPNPGSGDSPFNAGIITSDVAANGGTGGSIVYQWQESSDNINFTDIAGNMSLTYDPPGITQTTYYRRGAKRTTCPVYLYALSVVITVLESSICPAVLSFQRQAYTNAGCNGAGDYYFEVVLGNVTVDEQITLAGLPSNGVNITSSSLNGIAFNITTFLDNLHYISSSSFRWPVHAANGVAQTLRIYYCWVNNYPDPVALTTATALCSGITTPCTSAANIDEPGTEERRVVLPAPLEAFYFTAEPNPGTDQILLTYFGELASQSSLSIFSVGGQLMSTRHFPEMDNLQQWQIETNKLPAGVYFLRLQTNHEVRFKMWEKL
ncbi:MAG: T9SS type A sorting domain-containing protein [Lewinellaceae bacterium]|nr:T9SS type A sorting domain-containing protein [Lewinellaceae bacterium]